MAKKRRDAVQLLSGGRDLAEAALRQSEAPAARAERLAAGLAALWPAPLTAALLLDPDGPALAVLDEAGHPHPDWCDALRPDLIRWAEDGTAGSAAPAPAPAAVGLADHVLHGTAVGWGGRRHGALAIVLHKRTVDASQAEALLTHLADHVGFRLSQEEAGRQEQARYRDLADLTNVAGHEFNNVLNSIGLRAAVLGQKGLTPDRYPELREMRQDLGAAGTMVRRLQDYCVPGSPPRAAADLNRAVRRAVAADPSLVGRVRVELSPDVLPVQGTALDLERLAAALLRGSAGAAPPLPGAVTVGTGKGKGATVWLRVEDAGPDPDDDLLPRLFEPFVALRAGDDGVSLALAKGVVRRLGGSLGGDRRAGGGMTFVAELRAAETV